MQIHRVLGRDLNDALRKARRLHGDQARVLSREGHEGGGVTIAVVDDRRVPAALRPRSGEGGGSAKGRRRPEPGLADVKRRMQASGASADFTGRVLAAVRRSGAKGPYAIDVAAAVIGRAFPLAASPKVGDGGTAIAFTGPTGVGKTTTLAKLAIRLVQSGRRVALATLDTYRVGAVDQLQAYADLLQVPMHVAQDGAGLAAELAGCDADVVLVDTTGRSPRDAEHLARLGESLAHLGEERALLDYLVLSAATRPHDLDEAGRGFAATKPSGLVFTKLDETREPVAALEYSLYSGLGLAFLCDGQDVRGHLHRPHPERLADLVLRGRIL